MSDGNEPDLAVIVPSYETRDLLARCLESVFAGLGDLRSEVFVVDNASTDGSADMVMERFGEALLERNGTNVGFARAVNQALRRTKARHVLLLNSDTELGPEVLPACVRYMDAHREVGVLGTHVRNPDGSVQRTSLREPSLGRLLARTLGTHRLPRRRPALGERDVEMVAGCFLCARRSAIERVGPLDESFFFYGEDADWCRRFREAGWGVRVAPLGKVTHVRNASGSRLGDRRQAMLAEAFVRFHAKHGGRGRARLAWLLVGGFHALRCGWFGLTGTLRPAARARNAGHKAALRALPSFWPG